ncbi:MAG: (p)ppGpp synthetase I, SpoT/RelA [uncultured bacterium]|nr:MAG: (p)ppGpp synthetase I, SpoT/RelA [uncultured bacterium]
MLAQLASVIAELQANIDDVEVSEREINFYQVQFRIFVKNRLHLAQIMKALRQIPSVLKITRLIS